VSDPQDPGQEIGVLAAIVSRQSLDLNVYAGFLVHALAGSLPPDYLIVKRKSSLTGRLRGQPAPVVSVAVRLGDQRFVLQRPSLTGPPQCSIAHEVGGIVLKTEPTTLDEWSRQLASALAALARSNVATAAALAQITRLDV
jgi:hypothetical protein